MVFKGIRFENLLSFYRFYQFTINLYDTKWDELNIFL